MIISILRQTHMFDKSWATSLCPIPELLFWQNTVIKRIQVEAEKGPTRISHMLSLIDGWESEIKVGQQWDAMGIALYSGQVTSSNLKTPKIERLNDKHIKAPRMANIHPLEIHWKSDPDATSLLVLEESVQAPWWCGTRIDALEACDM